MSVAVLVAAVVARALLNTARRFAYPFAPALSRGLGVPLTSVTPLLAANQATGLASPLVGALADHWGQRGMMLAGVALLAGGMLGAGLVPLYGTILVGLVLAGLGKSCFDPALLAYVSDRVGYARRGLVVGLVELGWAASSLVGIPLVGLLIDRHGWRAPFLVLGGSACVMLAVLARVLRGDGRRSRGAAPGGLARSWGLVARSRPVRGALAYGFLFPMASDNLFVVYGAWLERDFGLTLVALGAATTVIGVAELAGEGLTAAVADRVGLGRAAVLGAGLTAAGYAVLPLLGGSLTGALVGLFVVFLGFEFTVVTAISFCTELVPGARATTIASMGAASSLGRVVGALSGGPIWLAAGLGGTAGVSAILGLLACASLAWSVQCSPHATRTTTDP
ncbi:MAG: MFS transporter [Candidatus Rokuibacteriota bacterium]